MLAVCPDDFAAWLEAGLLGLLAELLACLAVWLSGCAWWHAGIAGLNGLAA
jgi:hypothetical protein